MTSMRFSPKALMSSNTYAPAIEWKLLLPMEGSWRCFHDGRSVCNDEPGAHLRLFGRRSLAIALFVACSALSVGLFLFEIYSPEYGFRMPWIQTEFDPRSQVQS